MKKFRRIFLIITIAMFAIMSTIPAYAIKESDVIGTVPKIYGGKVEHKLMFPYASLTGSNGAKLGKKLFEFQKGQPAIFIYNCVIQVEDPDMNLESVLVVSENGAEVTPLTQTSGRMNLYITIAAPENETPKAIKIQVRDKTGNLSNVLQLNYLPKEKVNKASAAK